MTEKDTNRPQKVMIVPCSGIGKTYDPIPAGAEAAYAETILHEYNAFWAEAEAVK